MCFIGTWKPAPNLLELLKPFGSTPEVEFDQMVDFGNDIDFTLSAAEAAIDVAAVAPVALNRTKRSLDLVIAVLLLPFLLPLLIVIAIWVKADSRGPVLFMQRRTGFAGAPIRVIKFRTMTVVEDGDSIRHAAKGDDRVTRVGRFLRRSSLDELPQLINVIKGDMSLIGPRPHAIAHDQYYGALVPHYGRRFRARPGITGLAQVNGLRGEIQSLDMMARRVDLDNAYIEDWSLALDLQILIKTAVVAASQADAY